MAAERGFPPIYKTFWVAWAILMPVWLGAFFLAMWQADRSGRAAGPMRLVGLVILVGAVLLLLFVIAGTWNWLRHPDLFQPGRGTALVIAAIYYPALIGLVTFIYIRRLLPAHTDPVFVVWQYSTTVSALGGPVVIQALAERVKRVRRKHPTTGLKPPTEASVS